MKGAPGWLAAGGVLPVPDHGSAALGAARGAPHAVALLLDTCLAEEMAAQQVSDGNVRLSWRLQLRFSHPPPWGGQDICPLPAVGASGV
ncbi:hypothetical protein NDU88_000484 [Pleurodeles waltl]|uniref:Uncharacterized protein n=1 Tax=Pleurodeles waltl TaxID=8319 RepID=A0AAV7V5V2_PLEWA|nr:hypothetical protein NDU88_000484 [Pleurodeles waltl]